MSVSLLFTPWVSLDMYVFVLVMGHRSATDCDLVHIDLYNVMPTVCCVSPHKINKMCAVSGYNTFHVAQKKKQIHKFSVFSLEVGYNEVLEVMVYSP